MTNVVYLMIIFHDKLQNGPDECELNSLETCALNVWNDVVSDVAFPVLYRMNQFFSYKISDINLCVEQTLCSDLLF